MTESSNEYHGLCLNQLKRLKSAAVALRCCSSEQKNEVLKKLSEVLAKDTQKILQANQKDQKSALEKSISGSMLDRLVLTEERINAIVKSVEEVVLLKDPVGTVVDRSVRPNGIEVIRERTPLGVIFMIYESRPNVTIDAASLAFKAGNAILLRGGSETVQTNQALIECWQEALAEFPDLAGCVEMVTNQSHATVDLLLTQEAWIDLVIPRGGHRLIENVVSKSRIPVLKHYQGVCHCYVDHTADWQTAINIVVDGKLSRPGVCNALETLLVHENVAPEFWRELDRVAKLSQLELRVCPKTLNKLNNTKKASPEDFGFEFLAKILAVKTVSSVEEAIAHIQAYGSRHTEVIVSCDTDQINQFEAEVDASVIMENCSSRFSDGGELGLGAEIGISTTKLHAYGPMGLESLTVPRFVVKGNGQIRHPSYRD